MPQVHFPDSAGKTLTLQQYGDKRYLGGGGFSQEVLENIPNVHLRDDDVLLCSYPKSGCHWLWEMARMLQARTSKVDTVEKEKYMMENHPQSQLSLLPSPRILNTHVLFEQLPQPAKDGKVRILFIYRNPKDVAVSFFHHFTKIPSFQYSGQFGDYLTGLFFKGQVECGDVLAYLRDWERVLDSRPDLPIFVLSYEELHADILAKARELAKFLGSSADDDAIRDIVDKCTIGSMRERKGKEWIEQYGEPVMYRKGKVGDWKNWFTVAQNETMDQIIEKEMKGSRFQFQYTL